MKEYKYSTETRVVADKLFVCCPYHEEKTPSMMIDVKNYRYQCLSCGDYGSIPENFDDAKAKLEKLLFVVNKMIAHKKILK